MTSLKKNFIYNITYQVLLIILPLITAPYVSRVLGVEGIGTYSYTYSIAYYFGIFGMLGISNHGNRSIALVKENKEKISSTFSNIYAIQFLFTLLAVISYIIFVHFIFVGNKIIAMIDLLVVISYMLDINWFFFGMEQFKVTVARNCVIKLLTLICTFIFVKNTNDLWIYTLILALGTLFSQVYLWFNLKKYIDFKKPNILEVKKNIKPVLVLFVPVIAFSIYKIMDKIMLGNITTVYEVGLYENSEKIINIPVGIITAFGTVMMPRISSLIGKKEEKKINMYNEISFRYFSAMAYAMVGGLIGVSKNLAPIYFGNEFSECSKLIAGLSVTIIFTTWANIIRTQYLIPNKLDKPYVISTISGAVVNFMFNMIFISKLGAMGAVIGTILAEFSVFFIQAIYTRKEFFVWNYIKNTIFLALFSMFMAVIVYMIGEIMKFDIITLIIQVFAGIIIYVTLVTIYLIKIRDDVIIKILKNISRKVKLLIVKLTKKEEK